MTIKEFLDNFDTSEGHYEIVVKVPGDSTGACAEQELEIADVEFKHDEQKAVINLIPF